MNEDFIPYLENFYVYEKNGGNITRFCLILKRSYASEEELTKTPYPSWQTGYLTAETPRWIAYPDVRYVSEEFIKKFRSYGATPFEALKKLHEALLKEGYYLYDPEKKNLIFKFKDFKIYESLNGDSYDVITANKTETFDAYINAITRMTDLIQLYYSTSPEKPIYYESYESIMVEGNFLYVLFDYKGERIGVFDTFMELAETFIDLIDELTD